ncbi:XRE family transcriptional regulator [Streptomyces sp. NPDC088258]|uniref:nSTAND1 domain-containing NTPase n=1 Tax=Streptomyces sp. NPDC088258 TaxID=3365849 RepID=UPI00382C3E60
MVPRGERPLGTGDGAPLRLAAELRLLRQRAGSPTYRELARISHYSVAALSSAAAGTKLPSLAVTVAYATACGGDRAEWERRWHALAAEHARDEPEVRTDGGAGRADGAPYAGLAEFRAEDADRFFGRERLIEEVEDRLASKRFVTVVGASGAGKSSLLRAGVVPRRLRASPEQPVVVLTPGPCPLEETATRLAGPARTSPGALVRDLADSPRALHRAVCQALADRPDGTELLLVVDQFEEVFTLCRDPTERTRFIDALLTAATAENSRCRVVLGVRADFYAHCTDHAELGRAMSEAQVPVGPMTTDELRRAIVRPAVDAGYQVEGALVTDLVSQAKGQAAVLPLLSHALLETWRRRRGTALTLAGYHATGGIDGALAHTAESLYGALSPGQQRAARDLLLRLTALGEGTEDTRRRITRAELDPGPDAGPAPDGSARTVLPAQRDEHATDTAVVIERFTAARLLTLDLDSVEITHEALIRCWPRLRGWLLEDREGQRIHRALTRAAHGWEAVGRDPGALYRGVRLAGARQWGAAGHGARALSGRERAFLDASLAAQAAEERAALRSTRRLRHLTLLLALLLVCTATAAGLAVQAQRRATGERDTAVSQRVAEQAAALRPTNPAGALQLALSAYRLRRTVAARGALLSSYATPYATRLVAADRVDAVALRPGGRVLATAERRRAVRLWDVTDPHRPRLLATLDGRPGAVHSMAFSPDGRLLAAADESGRALVWDVSVPSRAGAPAVLKGAAVAVAFGRDSRTLATVGDSGPGAAVRLWHTARRCRTAPAVTPAGVLPGHGEQLDSLAFGRDGRTLAAGGSQGVWLWDLGDQDPAGPAGAGPCEADHHAEPSEPVNTRAERIRVSPLPVRSLTLSPDGRTLAAGGHDYAVRLWKVTGPGRPARTPVVLTGHTDNIGALAFSHDGHTLASGSVDATVRLWDTTDPARAHWLTTLSGHGHVPSLGFSRDGHTLVSAGGDRTARLWDLPGPVLVGHTSSVYGVTFSPDGRTVATGSYDSTVRLWNVSDPYRPVPGAVLSGHTAAVNDVAFAPDGRTLASASLDRTILLRDTAGPGVPRAPARLTGHHDAVNSIAFGPDGRVLASGGADRTVRLWDTADRLHPKRLAAFTAHGDQVEAVAFSRDGRVLATGGADHTVRLWDTTRPRAPHPLAELTEHQDKVKAVAFSPRGHILATASEDRTLRLWDVTDPRAPAPLAAPGGYTDAVRALAFSPDGRTLATASTDRPVRLWDLADPRHPTELALLSGHTKPVDALAFAPDGRTLATAGEDWTALLRDLDTDRVADRICRTTGHQGLSRAEVRQLLPGLPYRPPCGTPR